jgi:hypothetical protein
MYVKLNKVNEIREEPVWESKLNFQAHGFRTNGSQGLCPTSRMSDHSTC